MVSREELLGSIQPGMKLTKNFFMRIYGYEITWPGFAGQALTALEDAGCSKAREYYTGFVEQYEATQEESVKDAAAWYHGQLEQKWKKEEGEEKRKQNTMADLLRRKKQLLLMKKSQILMSNYVE